MSESGVDLSSEHVSETESDEEEDGGGGPRGCRRDGEKKEKM